MMSEVPRHIEAFWRDFVRSARAPVDALERFYESFRIGSSEEDAEQGARLVLVGTKTATSSLLWEYEALGKAMPRVGVLSVLEDGMREPVCVVETTWLEVIPFGEIDAAFT